MHTLIWSEQVPSIPGWYWEKGMDGAVRILYLPHYDTWPRHWSIRKADTLEAVDSDEIRKELDKLNWVVKWAGPIPLPTEA